VHDLLFSNQQVRNQIIETFGNVVVDETPGGAINRTMLGAIVFQDAVMRKKLEAIIHPAALAQCDRIIAENPDLKLLAFLVPLLFEANIANRYDEIWTITCDEKTIRQRLKARDGLSDVEIDQRLLAQLSQDEKAAKANYTIDNSGTLLETEKQILPLLQKYLA
jgi:dephospho-CoA kinase